MFTVVFVGVLAYSIYRAIGMIKKLCSGTVQSIADFYGQVSLISNYYVGVKVYALKLKPTLHYVTVDYLWNETSTRNMAAAEATRNFIKKHLPSMADKLIIKKASVIKDAGGDKIHIKSMLTTPGVNAAEYSILCTISAVLSAGRLIKEHFPRNQKWNDL